MPRRACRRAWPRYPTRPRSSRTWPPGILRACSLRALHATAQVRRAPRARHGRARTRTAPALGVDGARRRSCALAARCLVRSRELAALAAQPAIAAEDRARRTSARLGARRSRAGPRHCAGVGAARHRGRRRRRGVHCARRWQPRVATCAPHGWRTGALRGRTIAALRLPSSVSRATSRRCDAALREPATRDSQEQQRGAGAAAAAQFPSQPVVARGSRRIPGPRGPGSAGVARRRAASRRRRAGAGMSLRSATACWFELLTSRDELGAALDCLARTRSVQLQAYSRVESRLPLGDLQRVLDDYRGAGTALSTLVAGGRDLHGRCGARAARRAAGRARPAACLGCRRRTGRRRTRSPRAGARRTRRARAAVRSRRCGVAAARSAWPRQVPCSPAASTCCRRRRPRCRCRPH